MQAAKSVPTAATTNVVAIILRTRMSGASVNNRLALRLALDRRVRPLIAEALEGIEPFLLFLGERVGLVLRGGELGRGRRGTARLRFTARRQMRGGAGFRLGKGRGWRLRRLDLARSGLG